MQPGQPSRTALGAAGHRAAHQVLEQGAIFSDPLAVPILGPDAGAQIDDARTNPAKRGLRLFVAIRAHIAEDSLAAAVARGVRQLVILGAGLDTYAYRGALRDRVRIFEVDHPATQAWKRARLAEAAIQVPASLTFAPIDFERETLPVKLNGAGFDATQPSFFVWLGTVPYLSEAAIEATLGFAAGLAAGAEIVFDYPEPIHLVKDPKARASREALAARTAAAGEPIISHFEPQPMRDRLLRLGFRTVEDWGAAEITERFAAMLGGPWRGGAHVVRASTL